MSGESDEEEFSQPESSNKVEIEVKDSKKTKELEERQKELEDRLQKAEDMNADVVSVIEGLASKEFTKEKIEVASKLKIDPNLIESPDDLRAYEKLLQTKESEENFRTKNQAPSHGTPLTGAQTGDIENDQSDLPLEYRNYQSEAEMIADLENERKKGNKEAERYLSKLTKKSLKRDFEAEFQGDLPKSAGKGEDAKRERKKWREIK